MGFENEYFQGKTYYGESVLTDEQKMLKADLEKLQQDMLERKRLKYSAQENQEYFEERMYKIQEAFYLRNQSIAESLRAELEKKKEQYLKERKKSAVEDFVELQRLQLKYQALPDEQLIEEAQDFIGKPTQEWTLDRLSVLNAELAKRGIDKIGFAETAPTLDGEASGAVQTKTFPQWIQARGGDRPWEIQNPELLKALRLFDNPYGEFSALTEDGAVIPGLLIGDAYVEPKDK